MTITPLIPDAPPAVEPSAKVAFGDFSAALNDAGEALLRADRSETAFASGGGSLQDAIFERAKADVVLSVASAAAQRTAQALSTILSMQI
ncbi:MAG: flagellar hook-basal body complex protein FliE [Candidatus Eremiobacteraeota bacterium]|nr:flagellar hook-basal body complex protein FliE [Candidatus Eremiobacteraeota bacterium]